MTDTHDDHIFVAVDLTSENSEDWLCRECGDAQDSQNHRNDPSSITTPLEEILVDDDDDPEARFMFSPEQRR